MSGLAFAFIVLGVFFQDKQEYFTLHKASTKSTTQLQAEGHFTLILWYVLFSLLKTLQ